jgi:hypothetical protein
MHKLFCGLWIRYNLIGYRSKKTSYALRIWLDEPSSTQLDAQKTPNTTPLPDQAIP